MRPIIIGIGSSHSGAGKTTLAETILKNLKGWGAIKYSRTELYSSIIEEESVILEEGKDTKRLFEAGAERVIWIKSPSEGLSESIEIAIQALGNLKGIIIEGNSAVRASKPDIIIFIVGKEKNKTKEGIEALLKNADIIICDDDVPEGLSAKTCVFKMRDREDIIIKIKSIIKEISEKNAK